jgi:hypothetical protein
MNRLTSSVVLRAVATMPCAAREAALAAAFALQAGEEQTQLPQPLQK